MARYSTLRASDSDRDRVAERLRNATAEGRILAEELEERLGTVFAARTYGELDAVVTDIPGASPAGRPRSRPRQLMVEHPIMAVAILVAVTVTAFVLAIAVLAVAFALFSGGWVLLAVMYLILRGGPRRGFPYDRRRFAAPSSRSPRTRL
jgi:hypothetical protein